MKKKLVQLNILWQTIFLCRRLKWKLKEWSILCFPLKTWYLECNVEPISDVIHAMWAIIVFLNLLYFTSAYYYYCDNLPSLGMEMSGNLLEKYGLVYLQGDFYVQCNYTRRNWDFNFPPNERIASFMIFCSLLKNQKP